MAKLSVLVGAPRLAAALPAGQVVVVEADIDRARALKLELQEIGAFDRVLIAAEVITADYGQPVLWHRFNDGRLDGPWPLEHWHALYPNLKAHQIEERTGRSLAEVLNIWLNQLPAAAADKQKTMITLVLRQGDALATLTGCGAWLRDIQSVQLDHPVTTFSEQQAVASWLSQRGFCTADGNGLQWQRDPISTLRFELEESHEKIMQMEEQLSCHAVHLLLAETKIQEFTAERDQLHIEKEILLTEKQQFTEQVSALTQQRDDLGHERDARTAERDQLHIEKEILLTEKQQFTEQVSALTQQRDDLGHERDARTAERDQLLIERDTGRSHIADLEAHLQRTTDECNSLRAQYLSQQNRLDQINKELDEILALINTNMSSDDDNVIPSQ